MTTNDKNQIITQFKNHLVEVVNQDVYYQLKSWLEQCDIEDEDYSEVLDYVCDNLTGSLDWVDS